MPASTKARSYTVRNRVAELIGAPLYHDFSTEMQVVVAHPQSGDLDLTLATLTGTANAGFLGITGYFTDPSGRHFTRSLGLVTRVMNAGTWETI